MADVINPSDRQSLKCEHMWPSSNPGGVMQSWPTPHKNLNRVFYWFCNNCPAMKIQYEFDSGNKKEIIVEAPTEDSEPMSKQSLHMVCRTRNGHTSYLMNSELWSFEIGIAVQLAEKDAKDIVADFSGMKKEFKDDHEYFIRPAPKVL